MPAENEIIVVDDRSTDRTGAIVVVLVILILRRDSARFLTVPPWHGVAFPAATLLFIFILWRSMLTALLHGASSGAERGTAGCAPGSGSDQRREKVVSRGGERWMSSCERPSRRQRLV